MRSASLLLITALIGFGAVNPAKSDACLSYEPATTTITGTIQRVHGYGPPNFGETPATDMKTVYTLLTPDHPVCVAAGKDEIDEARSGVRQIEIVGSDNAQFKFAEGSRVSVTGKLTMSGVERGSPVDVMLMLDSPSEKAAH